MKKILWFLLIVIVGICYIAYSSLWQPEIDVPTQVTAVTQSPVKTTITSSLSSESNGSIQADTPNGRRLTTTEMAVKSDWMRRQGLSAIDQETYKDYSDEQLMELSEKGDFNAMHVLGIRKLTSEGVQAAIPFAKKEIIYGSLRGISTMANYLGPDMSSDMPIDELKKQLLESTAYYKFYSMRGDQYSAKLFSETQIKSFETAYKIDQVFNEDDEAWINNRATELYDHYQAERYKLGLGDFDNEVPQEVRTFFGE